MIVFRNIRLLLQTDESDRQWRAGREMAELPYVSDAYLVVSDGRIADYGPMSGCPDLPGAEQIDASGRLLLPAFVDSHTHLVFAHSREGEFVDRIHGLSYEEIARRGGGILNSARRLQEASEEELFEGAWGRLREIVGMGTGAVEVKSGYGLTLADELKMLRVARRLKDASPIAIKTTFLGAHAIPSEYAGNRKAYLDLIVDRMIPQVADEGLADYCDVFCDRGFFTVEETDRILAQGLRYGLVPKIHANELDYSGGVQVGVKHGALSVDHLECTGPDEIAALLGSRTMPTLLPSTAFFLGLEYPPARRMIEAGLPVSLASDYNPGSSPSGNMPFVISLACIKLRMTPEEALHAATVNAAYALGLSESHGRIRRGAPAHLALTAPMPSLAYLPYAFGSQRVEGVWIDGKRQS
jgi:imidazolonepropionase